MKSILLTAADFETSLEAQVAAGDSVATLESNIDLDGIALANGLYGFTVDGDVEDSKEYIVATVTGTALTGVVSVSRQGVATADFQKFHRRGASIAITDWAALYRVVSNLNGVISLDSGVPLAYDAAPALGSSNQLATVQYVLDHINGGAISFNSMIFSGIAGETITSGQWVFFNEADGRWYLTDATNLAKSFGVRIGKALGAGTAGNAISGGVFVGGLETVGTYSAHTTYYLSNTPGAIATSAGTNSVVVGVSDANSKLVFALLPASERDAATGSSGVASSINKFITQDNVYSASADQSQLTQNAVTIVGAVNSATDRNKVAQSLIPTRTKIRGVQLYKIADSGSFTGTVTVAIQADSAGSPSGTNLASVTMSNAEWLLLAAGVFTTHFATEAAVIAGSTYWIVVSTSTADNTNHPNLGTSSASTYANGILKYNNTSDGWVTTSTDLYFTTLNGVISQVAETDSTTGMIPVSISPIGLIDFQIPGTGVSGTTTETTVYTKQLPPSALKTIAGIFVKCYAAFASAGTTWTVRFKLNGTTVLTLTYTATANAVPVQGQVEAFIVNNSSQSAQKCSGALVLVATGQNVGSSDLNPVGSGGDVEAATATVDVSGGAVLTITVQAGSSSGSNVFTLASIAVSKVSL